MKSPNGPSSLKNLLLAMELLKTAREDLKNDPDLRDLLIHFELHNMETNLTRILLVMKGLGYAKD